MRKLLPFAILCLLLTAGPRARAGTDGHDDPKQDDERYYADDDKAPNPLPWKLPDGKTAQVSLLMSFGHEGSQLRAIVVLGDRVWEIASDQVDNSRLGGELHNNADGTVLVRLGLDHRITVTWDKDAHRPVAKPAKKSK